MKLKKYMTGALAFLLVGMICFSGVQILAIDGNYRREEDVRGAMERFKPTPPAFTGVGEPAEQDAPPQDAAHGEKQINRSVADARRAVNADIAGWITIPNTRVDYPFVQAADNEAYLHRDVNGESAAAGTIFLDSRSSPAFTDFNTILYGHHMKNGSMFGGLASFENRSFFEENETAVIFLENETYILRFFAFMVIQPDDTLYGTAGDADGRETEILRYARDNARYYRDIGVTAQERIVTLSTCAYEFRGARMVLLARLEPCPD